MKESRLVKNDHFIGVATIGALRRLFTNPSILKITKAPQIKAKVMALLRANSSPYTTTASKNIKLGPMYWKNPRVDNRKRVAAPVKHSSGKVVSTPANTNRAFSCQALLLKSLVGESAKQSK